MYRLQKRRAIVCKLFANTINVYKKNSTEPGTEPCRTPLLISLNKIDEVSFEISFPLIPGRQIMQDQSVELPLNV